MGSPITQVAQPGEIPLSRTITDLVAGTGLVFHGRAKHALAGIERRWPIYAVGGASD